MMKEIFEKATETARLNKLEHELSTAAKDALQAEKKNQKEKRREKGVPANLRDTCFSSVLYDIILNLGFTIEGYEPSPPSDDPYYPIQEIYYLRSGDWTFHVENHPDPDIDQGIFAVRDVRHHETQEEVKFYCDLGCQNTGENRLAHFLSFLTYSSVNAYVKDTYAVELLLPTLLKKHVKVEEMDYGFCVHEPTGCLKINDKPCFVKFYRFWGNEMRLVVTNKKNWNTNSRNGSYGDIGYHVDFKTGEMVPNVLRAIEALERHESGQYGFLEGKKYYKNRHVTAFFDLLRSKEDPYKECWNTYQIKVKYEKMPVNLYEGVEIGVKTELTFNDAAQWRKGDWVNTSFISVTYNRKNAPEHCSLVIENYVHHKDETLIEWNEEGDKSRDVSKRVGVYQKEGTFSDVMRDVKQYTLKMIDIHNIKL